MAGNVSSADSCKRKNYFKRCGAVAHGVDGGTKSSKHIGESSNRYTSNQCKGSRWNKRRRTWPSRRKRRCSAPFRFSGSCAGPRDSSRVHFNGYLRWYQRITHIVWNRTYSLKRAIHDQYSILAILLTTYWLYWMYFNNVENIKIVLILIDINNIELISASE